MLNEQLLFLVQEIFALASGIVQGLIPGSKKEFDIGQSLLSIVQKGMAAYEAQVGKPIDPSLLKPYEPIP